MKNTMASAMMDKSAILSLRRCILLTLYRFFVAHPYANMELSQLREDCDTNAEALNWNIVYLERYGFVELTASSDCFPFVSCAACISVKGIDLVENETVLNEKFPEIP